jgi:phage-related minor tail protein
MPDGAQKAAAAVALFGKSGADLIPLLNEGATGLERFKSKLTPEEFEEFTKRSDQFGESLTELGLRTDAFGLELTDALLPALQSILEVFSDLFNTKQDWTALFKVITVGIRIVATVIYAMVKLVDQLAKAVVYTFDAIRLAVQGDFEGAGRIISQNFGAGLEQAKRDFAQIQKIFTDSPAPKATTRDRPQTPDTSAADAAGAAAARKAATEQERAAQRYNEGLKGAIDLAGDLNKQIRDIKLTTKSVGASPVQKISNELQASLNAIQDEQETLFKKADEFTSKTGVQFEGLRNKIRELGAARKTEAAAVREQGLKDLLPSVDEYDAKIAEVVRGKTELTELEKLNAQVNLLQLDILAATNPALAEHVRLLRERAGALDAATAKQKTDNESIGAGIKDRLQEYYNSIKDIGGAIGDAVVGSLKGLEDQLTAFVTTGKASFNDLAASIIQDLSRIAIRAAIIKPITEAISSLFPGFKFANGGIMTGDGPMPLKKYASGGIARSPQLAMFGEGSRPEAFVPLPDGRRIPVAMQGGGGGSTNVTVNVDASGNASVQGDQSQAKQLGVAVSAAVQAELVKQQRPGGLLAGTRR